MRRVWIGLLVVAVLASVWYGVTRRSPAPPAPGGARGDSAGTGLKAVRLFFASPDGDSLVSETREILEQSNLHERVAALVAELDRGPRGGGVAALPAGTSVLHAYLDEGGGLTLDLSRAFEQGFRGGAMTEYAAVASLVRTLGANLPEVKRVLLVCGGAPLATLGGHVPLDQPFDVSEWL